MKKLIDLINESRKMINKSGIISVNVGNEDARYEPNILMRADSFLENKARYGWVTTIKTFEEYHLESVMIDGIEVYCFHWIEKEAV